MWRRRRRGRCLGGEWFGSTYLPLGRARVGGETDNRHRAGSTKSPAVTLPSTRPDGDGASRRIAKQARSTTLRMPSQSLPPPPSLTTRQLPGRSRSQRKAVKARRKPSMNQQRPSKKSRQSRISSISASAMTAAPEPVCRAIALTTTAKAAPNISAASRTA